MLNKLATQPKRRSLRLASKNSLGEEIEQADSSRKTPTLSIIAEQSAPSDSNAGNRGNSNAGSSFVKATQSDTSTAAVMAEDNGDGGGDGHVPRVTPAMNRRRVFDTAIRRQLLACTDEFIANSNLVQLAQEISKLQRNWDKFEYEHLAVVGEEVAGEAEQNAEIYSDAENNQSELMGQLRAREAECMKAEGVVPNQAENRPLHLTIDTPDILGNIKETWGKFSGDFSKWQDFRGLFEAGVHENDKITAVHKFQLLKNALKGEAASTVGSWQITETNYARAWKRLCEKYDDDYLAVQTITNRLLQFKRNKDEPVHAFLRRLADTVHECTNQLAVYMKADGSDTLFLFIVVSKLDDTTFERWEAHRQTLKETNDEQGAQAKACAIPALEKLTEFLETQARIRAHVQSRDDADENKKTQSRESSSNRGGQSDRNANRPNERSKKDPQAGQAEPNYPPCILCGQNHGLYNCLRFRQMSLAEREKVKNENDLCEVCLKQHGRGECRHVRKDCPKCRISGLAHNTWLCKTREAEQRTALMSVVGNSPQLSMRT